MFEDPLQTQLLSAQIVLKSSIQTLNVTDEAMTDVEDRTSDIQPAA